MNKIIFIFLISFTTIFAQSAGNSGLAFLKLGFGARNISMGDVGAETSNDVSAFFYNPARLADNDDNEIMLMHNSWIQGTTSEILGVKTSVWDVPLAFGVDVTSIDDIQVRTAATDNPIATFNANYFAGSVSTGFNIYDNIAFGATIKYLYEGLYSDEATGWGFDFGLNYKTPVEGLSAAMVLRNLGSMNDLKNESTKLPTEFRIGPAYQINLFEKFAVTAAAEFQKYTPDKDDSHINYGAEILYDNLIALRGGYQSDYESKGFTAGFGLIWGGFGLDYAYQPFNDGLGDANIISLRFKF
ncbi:MAG: PorV/PorQ family protein [Ignavibacteriaceae bacterium]|jgi:hypothetical protein